MATYTITLKELLDEHFDFGLGRDDYPIFDERYRGVQNEGGDWVYTYSEDRTEFFGLNRKIIDHYLYFEIGQETPDMFRHMLNNRMREIMPYYNRLYRTESLISDPFQTMSMSQRGITESNVNEEVMGTTGVTASSTADSTSRAVNSNFPQTNLMDDGDYASSSSDTFSKSKSEQDSSTTGDEQRVGTTQGETLMEISGSTGVRARLLAEYRQSLLNIDVAIIQDLAPLFMLVNHKFDHNYRRGYYNAYAPYHHGLFPTF